MSGSQSWMDPRLATLLRNMQAQATTPYLSPAALGLPDPQQPQPAQAAPAGAGLMAPMIAPPFGVGYIGGKQPMMAPLSPASAAQGASVGIDPRVVQYLQQMLGRVGGS